MTAPVVVGVDGSEPSQAAIELGVREAQLRDRPLRLVHAFEWPLLGVYLGPSPEGPAVAGLAAEADRVVADALAHATAVAGGGPAAGGAELAITGEVVTGAVVPVLLAEATRAALVVLGDRGLGGFTGLLVGSVAVQLAAHTTSPLLIARGKLRAHGPVVVGVDGSTGSSQAVEFALAEAAARGAELVAVSAWSAHLSSRTEDALPLVYDASDIEATQARLLREALADGRQRWPRVVVREEVRHGRPAPLLLQASAGAQLMVVGARGRGGFAGLLLGSVSQAVLHHASCPVAIIRHDLPESGQ